MDHADQAQQYEEIHLQKSLQRRIETNRPIADGFCQNPNCGLPFDTGTPVNKIFCDSDCAKDYEILCSRK